MLAGKRVLDHALEAVRASGLPHHVMRRYAVADSGRFPDMGDSVAAGAVLTR